MNCLQANSISIAGFLMSKGIYPDKQSGNNLWYCSPLRKETEPSFKVCRNKNVWFDYGICTGGRLVDLVCKMNNVGVPGALLLLSGAVTERSHISFPDKQEPFVMETKIEIKHLQPLQNRALIQYLTGRKISAVLASKFCNEVYYKTNNGDKQYFAISFENDSHGYEIRNKYFKGSSSPKNITTIPGENSFAVNVFEGFMDFLSSLTYCKSNQSASDTIVLNGLGFVEKFIEIMPKYTKINLYLDNDKAGKETAARIQDTRPDAVNRSQIIYPQYKDFNEYIINQ